VPAFNLTLKKNMEPEYRNIPDMSAVADVVKAYSHARRNEDPAWSAAKDLQLDTWVYERSSPAEQALALVNAERTDRGLAAL
jgi:hypothetical protein